MLTCKVIPCCIGELGSVAKASRLVVSSVLPQTLSQETLITLFSESQTKKQRDQKVMEAIKMGYSLQDIANVIGTSQPAVSLIVKKNG